MPRLLIAKRLFAVLLFSVATALLVHLIGDLNRVKVMKTDLAEINSVRYGLLDADQWASRVAAIIERKVDAFELTDANRPQIVKAVEQVLLTMLDEIERYLRQRNLGQHGGTWMDQLEGALKQGVQDLLIDFDRLQQKVPQYAEAVVVQLSKPNAKQEIKTQVLALLGQTSEATFARIDRTALNALLSQYQCSDPAVCSATLQSRIAATHLPIMQQLGGVIGSVALLFLVCLSGAGRRNAAGGSIDGFMLLLLSGATLLLLAGGLLTPMIEIEARIGELRLEFMGEPLAFTDQVLYFQTKSIFDVVRILAETGTADMLLVAVLITLFSVIFPALKLIATHLYYYDAWHLRASSWVRFFALRSGKWSMADVLVIAIFMAYLGFDGLVASQLGSLAHAGHGIDLLTTNGTALEPGFYLFLSFVLASLLLSARLEQHGNPCPA